MCAVVPGGFLYQVHEFHRSVTGSVRQRSVPRDSARSSGATSFAEPAAAGPVLGQQPGEGDMQPDRISRQGRPRSPASVLSPSRITRIQ